MRFVNDCLRSVQSRLWGRREICLLCAGGGAERGLCAGCRSDLPWQGAACLRCALPLATDAICGACLRAPPPQDGAWSAFDYRPPLDFMIRRLKFHSDLSWARVLGGLMAEEIPRRCDERPDLIVPVPLHRRRLAARGYNQALELARPLARRLGVPLAGDLCQRLRPTLEQTALDAAARRANVRAAFAVRRSPPATVAIVDDVLTTGSTVAALAQSLRRAGAKRVLVWVCARATLSLR
ncbi:MAG: ComF family protein [Gammaproteobacteria bacterium]|jgi:ComF family protein|nr:ComF family protein [Gammaproteobacteria bacterium]